MGELTINGPFPVAFRWACQVPMLWLDTDAEDGKTFQVQPADSDECENLPETQDTLW